eukprot:TRINITY_DN94632_c0_g1_i1.p1 TRINITY_DN94632_c0_g1~~TRINITY_DN94632_c0_g1_i1.p1  ORF type:complete len:496 (+),score=63.33 TRINITY_DN94632_c0_g1_i1:27-1514(+)
MDCDLCCCSIEVLAIFQCNHITCHKCALRLRVLMGKKECSICTVNSTKVLLTHNLASPDYKRLEPQCNKYDREGDFFYDSEDVLDTVRHLRNPRCPICKPVKEFTNIRDMQAHCRQHRLQLCGICVEKRMVFLGEHTVYTDDEMKQHNDVKRHCLKDSPQFRGHPLCEFCKIHTYDNDDFFIHMKTHELCHICEKGGHQFEYYRGPAELEQHFRRDHFFCPLDDCRQTLFERVFQTEVDLRAHMLKQHGDSLSKQELAQLRRIDLGFQYGPPAREDRRQDRDASDLVIHFMHPHHRGASPNLSVFHNHGAPPKPPPKPPAAAVAAAADEARERNAQLMARMKAVLGDQKFDTFRRQSSAFLRGEVKASDYYQQFLDNFGENHFEIFLELIELNPDPDKKKALMLVHNHHTSAEFGVPDPKPKAKPKPPKAKAQPKPAPSPTPKMAQVVAANVQPPPGALASPDEFPALQGNPKPARAKPKPKPKAQPENNVWFRR